MSGRPRVKCESVEEETRREILRERTRRQVERKRPEFRKVIDDFLNSPCVDCGNQYPRAAMHPDHVRDLDTKKYKISWFYYGNGSRKMLDRELAKCDVRCANCHCIRHATEETR